MNTPYPFPRLRLFQLRLALMLFAAAATIAPAGASDEPSTPSPWTLEAALDTAFARSPDARIARHRLAAAEALLQQSGAARMPRLTLHGGYTQTNSPMNAFGAILNQRAYDSSVDFNHPGRIDDLNLAATVSYQIYDGGRASASIAAARHGVGASAEDERSAVRQLGAGVVRSYLNIRKAAATVTAVEAGVRAYEAEVEVARAMDAAGKMLRADLLSLQVQLAQTREALIQARAARTLAEKAFLHVIGIDSGDAPVVLAAPDPSLERIRPPDALDASRRPELAALSAVLDAARSRAAAARGARRPSVNAFATYGYDRGWETDESGTGWAAGVSVDFNVFDGGAAAGAIRAAEAAVAEAGEALRKAQLGIKLEIEQARLAHDQARERVEVTAAAVTQAEESASLTRARFEEGAVPVADLIGVESRLIEARTRHTHAVADERIALADLRRSVGLLPFEQS